MRNRHDVARGYATRVVCRLHVCAHCNIAPSARHTSGHTIRHRSARSSAINFYRHWREWKIIISVGMPVSGCGKGRMHRSDPTMVSLSHSWRCGRNVWEPWFRVTSIVHSPALILSPPLWSSSPLSLLSLRPAVTHLVVAHTRTELVPPLTYPRYRQLRMSVRLMSLISTNVWTPVSRNGATKNGPRLRSWAASQRVIYRAVVFYADRED